MKTCAALLAAVVSVLPERGGRELSWSFHVADILEFQHTDVNRSLASRLATEHARQFIAYRRELDTANISVAEKEVRRRIEELRARGAAGSDGYSRLVESDQQLRRTMEALQTSNATLVHLADAAAASSARLSRGAPNKSASAATHARCQGGPAPSGGKVAALRGSQARHAGSR